MTKPRVRGIGRLRWRHPWSARCLTPRKYGPASSDGGTRTANTFTRAELDALYVARYGVSRAQLNAEILAGLPLQSVLEVGCNLGQQLRHLDLGSGVRLCGVDVQTEVLRVAQSVVPAATFVRADARSLPFADGAFDLVFTSGVLIHIPPADLGRAMDEIHRVSARWIWGLEYWSRVARRGHVPRRVITSVEARLPAGLAGAVPDASSRLRAPPSLPRGSLPRRRHVPAREGLIADGGRFERRVRRPRPHGDRIARRAPGRHRARRLRFPAVPGSRGRASAAVPSSRRGRGDAGARRPLAGVGGGGSRGPAFRGRDRERRARPRLLPRRDPGRPRPPSRDRVGPRRTPQGQGGHAASRRVDARGGPRRWRT